MKALVAAGVIALSLCSTTVAAADSPHAAVRNFLCQRALDPPARAVSVQAVMRPLPGTQRLSVRFQLLMTRKPSGPASLVRAGDLGTWILPADSTLGQQPGDVWKVSKPVFNLVAPRGYRFRAKFRWIGSAGRVLATAVRLSPVCWQPELRPDLLVRSIAVRSIAGEPGENQYSALIRNAGASAAGRFEIMFAPGGSLAAKTLTVIRLDPQSVVRETFVGPLCAAGSAPSVTVDPAGQIDDFDRSNNSLTASCPGSSG
jgi:hypothetical protein